MGVVELLFALALSSSPDKSQNQEPRQDFAPTAWACTVDTLIDGKDCVFEVESTAGSKASNQAKDNVRFAKQLADVACARSREGGAAEVGQATCRREFAKAAEGCGLGGKSPLVDSKGRFSPAARNCYLSLSSVLQHSSMQMALAESCCECVNSGQCKSASPQCAKHLANAAPTAGEVSCMRGACASACSGLFSRGGDL